jgi:hypothetical protein
MSAQSHAVRIFAHLNDGRWSFRVESDAQVADFSTLSEAEEAARALRGPVATWQPVFRRRHELVPRSTAGAPRVLP